MRQAGGIVDVPLDRTVDALQALREHPATGKVGLYGVSRGAEHALLLASILAKAGSTSYPDAVAVHAASDHVACLPRAISPWSTSFEVGGAPVPPRKGRFQTEALPDAR